jgi:hypothetical protein
MVRALVYSHRWLGIASGLLFAAWFVSGVVMMYAGMPELSPEERLARLPAMDWAAVTVTPAQAIGAEAPARVVMGTSGGRPVYRLQVGRAWRTVYADSGERLERLSAQEALALALHFAPEHCATARHDARIDEPDQWTFGVRALLPAHRIALGDPDGTDVYVSEASGEVVMKTTRAGRRWGYLGAVVHWVYFTPFRRHGTLWAETIIWVSIAGTLMAVAGLAWGVWRYSPARRYRLKRRRSRSPYAGWMRWHHYAGLVFGVTTITWVFSGLLSMDPWSWSPGTAPTGAQRAAVAGGRPDFAQLSVERIRTAAAALGDAREAELTWFQGEPFLHSRSGIVGLRDPERGVVRGLPREAMLDAARAAGGGAVMEEAVWMEAYDAYYYDRAGRLPLPVLRATYRDPQRTWLYLDPSRGAIARKEERLSRVNRWLYHGFHSLDFPWLYYRRPLWDVVMWVLSLGGLLLAATSATAGWRRLKKRVYQAGG